LKPRQLSVLVFLLAMLGAALPSGASGTTPSTWVVGGDALGGVTGVIGTTDGSPLALDAEGTAVLTSDGTTTTIGSTAAGTSVNVRGGSAGATFAAMGDVSVDARGDLYLGESAASISIGNVDGSFAASGESFSLDCGGVPDCQINIGDSAWSHNVSLGSTTGNSALSLAAGSGQLLIHHGPVSWAWPTNDGLVDSWALITDSHGNLYFAPPMAGPQSIVQIPCTLVAGAATCPTGYNLDAPAGAAKIVGAAALTALNGTPALGAHTLAYIVGNSVALTSYSSLGAREAADVATYTVSIIGAE
jgi:hypothetical protein